MRKRQSSLTMETQYPVISTSAPSLGVFDGGCAPRACANRMGDNERTVNSPTIASAVRPLGVFRLPCVLSILCASSLFLAQRLEHRFHEHVRRPETGRRSVQRIVIARPPGVFHL